MTTPRKIGANRRNAYFSTGPRSAAGKSRSRQNSLWHGLSAAHSAFTRNADVEEFARLIIGEREFCLSSAMSFLDAQLELVRVRIARAHAINELWAEMNSMKQIARGEMLARLHRLAAYDRYELRALSKRKKALRTFHEVNGHRN